MAFRDCFDLSTTKVSGIVKSAASWHKLWMNSATYPLGNFGNRSIVLVGMMGSGKSKIGQLLAKDIGLPFYDSDQVIQHESGKTIVQIFEVFGESSFREMEAAAIAKLLGEGPCVLSTGGGAILNEDTAKLIFEKNLAVWLDAPVEVLARRTGHSKDRPLLNNVDQIKTLTDLLEKRRHLYEKAHIRLDASEDDADKLVKTLLQAMERVRMSPS